MTVFDSVPTPGRRVTLGSWPTPVEPAPRLAEAIGLAPGGLWLKRDDLGGLGGGGNKIRKLEWTIGAALTNGADTLVTTGAPQSNHARLTAAAGARLGLRVVLVFPGEPGRSSSGNLALDGLFGAEIHWAGDVDRGQLATVATGIVDELRGGGARPELIPFGGSNAVGAYGYVEAGRELLVQVPDVDVVVVELGSGGTMAGLVVALGAGRVLGVDVGALPEPAEAVAALAGRLDGTGVPAHELRIRGDQVGDGYGHLTGPSAEALELTARSEGIVLDPIYTGRAMAGLAAAVRDGDIAPDARTVFLHTGGLPGLFGHPDTISRAESALGRYRPAPAGNAS
ncbi:pyridoxal-phosphate dependent enzyme [Micromonospora sp. NBC_01796]|uniref:pyridoxal-phosphate dependent enzyme n=1 Tax=Micromonospora sp. NBC_01796 TaxID=2975987 RepID=UPI002DD883D4|nr:pyridoxal-phosphate dependent enzyme [Micromonospora sp. NBC_01796]WSA88416.1 pyridoxal-phosphate dependent enzyme [Micromonospora sp. NBC_01796]